MAWHEGRRESPFVLPVYTGGMQPQPLRGADIALVGFDADDTLWRSQDYFDEAQARFEEIVAGYVDLGDLGGRLYAVEKRNLALFGYGVKGMTLSMVEAAIDLTGGRIEARDIRTIMDMGKDLLVHPVELLPGIADAVEQVAKKHRVVLITKGDLFHQERKVALCGLTAFQRIEIVSEKDAGTYRRLLKEFEVQPQEFAMVGNSLKSDIAPVVELGGWGVYMPYHATWEHELLPEYDGGGRVVEVDGADKISEALDKMAQGA